MSVRTCSLLSLNRPIHRALLAVFVTLALLSVATPAYAQGGPGGGGFAAQPLVDVLVALAEIVVQFVVFASGALLAVNIARGTFSAQLANLIGSPIGMSQAWMNLIGGVITFMLAALSPMLVSIIFDAVKAFVSTTITIPTF
jgi:hypothetical protein